MINNRYAKPFSISAIILGLHLLTTANAFIKFCSVVCANQSCNSNAYADCIECADPWTLSNVTNRCQISTLSQWSLVNYSSDVNANGSIIPNFTSTAFCNTSVSGEWSYRYSGNILGKNITRYTYTLGPTVPHY